jgi:lipopolysaccharide/colanic/teichoic acid biosynthesis glycosyltransferase
MKLTAKNNRSFLQFQYGVKRSIVIPGNNRLSLPQIHYAHVKSDNLKEQMYNEPTLKRLFDVLLAGLGLILSSWLWVLIGLAIVIEDGFPIMIRQRRVGRFGRLFPSYKFRSMKKTTLNEAIQTQAQANDIRITKVGRVLRKTAMDELPQLLNILVGDMSFVGPRALLPQEVEINGDRKIVRIEEIPGYDKRIQIRPGLTGVCQIFADRDLPRKYKFKYDLLHLEKRGLFFDIKLIVISFLVSFHGTWEVRGFKSSLLKRH